MINISELQSAFKKIDDKLVIGSIADAGIVLKIKVLDRFGLPMTQSFTLEPCGILFIFGQSYEDKNVLHLLQSKPAR